MPATTRVMNGGGVRSGAAARVVAYRRDESALRYGRSRAKAGRLHAARKRAMNRVERVAIARARAAVLRAVVLSACALALVTS